MNAGLMTMENRGLVLGSSDNPAIYAAAVRAAEEIKVAYQMALYRRRNIQQARQVLMDVCARPSFALLVEWEKPVGGRKIRGVTIRLIEEAIKAYGNIQTTKTTVYEDAVSRKIVVKVIDLENNISYEDETVIQKAVERSQFGDRTVISQRTNSKGEQVYLVDATEDEMLGKTNAQVSKMIRTLAKRLIPADLIEYGVTVAKRTVRKADSVDPKKASNEIFDSFKNIGITPDMVAVYVGSNKPIFTADELDSLRGLYTALKDKETTWREVVESLGKKKDDGDGGDGGKKKRTLGQLVGDKKEGAGDKKEGANELTVAQKTLLDMPLVNEAMAEMGIVKLPHELTNEECLAISKRADEIAERGL